MCSLQIQPQYRDEYIEANIDHAVAVIKKLRVSKKKPSPLKKMASTKNFDSDADKEKTIPNWRTISTAAFSTTFQKIRGPEKHKEGTPTANRHNDSALVQSGD